MDRVDLAPSCFRQNQARESHSLEVMHGFNAPYRKLRNMELIEPQIFLQ